jgi:hypothetical protein
LEVFLGFLQEEILGAYDAFALFADDGAELGLNLDADGVFKGTGFLKDAGGFLAIDAEFNTDVDACGELILRGDAGTFLQFFFADVVEGEFVEGVNGHVEALAIGFIDDFAEEGGDGNVPCGDADIEAGTAEKGEDQKADEDGCGDGAFIHVVD